MNKIIYAFEHGKAFIPFITCGDPSLEVTKQLVYAMEEAGADLIELGIPFSDPTAEGAVIQEANVRALKAGVTTDKIFEMVEELRRRTQIPLVFMTMGQNGLCNRRRSLASTGSYWRMFHMKKKGSLHRSAGSLT